MAIDLANKVVTVAHKSVGVSALEAAVRGVGYDATARAGDGDEVDLFGLSAPVGAPPGPVRLSVGGMSCMGNCGRKVVAALRGVAGVTGACVWVVGGR